MSYENVKLQKLMATIIILKQNQQQKSNCILLTELSFLTTLLRIYENQYLDIKNGSMAVIVFVKIKTRTMTN